MSSNILHQEHIYRITWELDGHFRCFDVRAGDMLDALQAAKDKLDRVGIDYYEIITITHTSQDIPF
jgi:hypothetical protein